MGVAIALSLALTACGEPAWMDPAKAGARPEPPFRLAGEPPPVEKKIPTSADSVPAPPAWAAGLIGKTLAEAYPGEGACMGNTDSVILTYQGATPGAKVLGWGWDPVAKHRIDRVVLLDGERRIVSAGEGGVARPDVAKAKADVTDRNTGWSADVPKVTGIFDSYGVLADGVSTCVLGRIVL